jgi:hypothetical protein
MAYDDAAVHQAIDAYLSAVPESRQHREAMRDHLQRMQFSEWQHHIFEWLDETQPDSEHPERQPPKSADYDMQRYDFYQPVVAGLHLPDRMRTSERTLHFTAVPVQCTKVPLECKQEPPVVECKCFVAFPVTDEGRVLGVGPKNRRLRSLFLGIRGTEWTESASGQWWKRDGFCWYWNRDEHHLFHYRLPSELLQSDWIRVECRQSGATIFTQRVSRRDPSSLDPLYSAFPLLPKAQRKLAWHVASGTGLPRTVAHNCATYASREWTRWDLQQLLADEELWHKPAASNQASAAASSFSRTLSSPAALPTGDCNVL